MSSEKSCENFVMDILKAVLKKGYVYAIGDDGELYCAKCDFPKKGGTITVRLGVKGDDNDSAKD